MKKIIQYIFFSSFITLVISCTVENSADEIEDLGFRALSMQLSDEEPLIARDTGYFSITVTNTNNKIVKFSADHLSNFEGFMGKTEVQVPYDVTVNEQGEFNRGVSTTVIKYPIAATTNPGEILTVDFTFTDDKGKTAKVNASKKVVNFKTFGTQQFLYVTRPFHSFHTGLSYGAITSDAAETFKDSLDVFWIRKDGIQYLASPDADATAEEFATRYTTSNYVQSEMQNVKIIKLDGVSLGDVDDDMFASMDFSAGVDKIVVDDGAVYGLLLEDGRKAAMEIVIYLTQYSRVRSKVQISPN